MVNNGFDQYGVRAGQAVVERLPVLHAQAGTVIEKLVANISVSIN